MTRQRIAHSVHINCRLACCTVLLAVGGTALAPVPAGASLGAGVGASPIALAHSGTPGRTYSLPGLYVVNTGTVRAVYEVKVERLSPGSQRVLPARWISIERNDFTLGPHRSTVVALRLEVPATAAAGRYLSDLVASTAPAVNRGGTAIGAAAATKLELTVAGGAATTPWQTIGLAAAGLLGAAALASSAGLLATRRRRRMSIRSAGI